MSPALSDGDYVLTVKPRRFLPGLIYVIDHGDLGRIIKRLDHIDGNRLIVSGDNAKSVTSAVMAPISMNRVTGRAFLAVSRNGLRRL